MQDTGQIEGSRMVAWCDVLGFSSASASNSKSAAWIHRQFHRAIWHSIFHSSPTKEVITPACLKSQDKVGVATFADTALFYALDDEDESCRVVLEIIAWLLFDTIHVPWGHTRAGVAYGEVLVDEAAGLYVGEAFTAAYCLEQEQDWAGGALAKTAERRLAAVAEPIGSLWYVIKYEVPLKRGKQLMLAVDWTRGIHSRNFSLEWSKNQEEPSSKDWIEDAGKARKWYYTKKFHDDVCVSCPCERKVA